MNRVTVIGNAGGGKSRLSRAICHAHNLPYHELDKIQWQPKWVPTDEAELQAIHGALLRQDRWLIDGYGPWRFVASRLASSDTIIFVDLPLRIHYRWAAKRQVKSLFTGRDDGPDGCRMWPVTIRLFKMMWWLQMEMRPKLTEAIANEAGRAKIIHIRSPKELNHFVKNLVSLETQVTQDLS